VRTVPPALLRVAVLRIVGNANLDGLAGVLEAHEAEIPVLIPVTAGAAGDKRFSRREYGRDVRSWNVDVDVDERPRGAVRAGGESANDLERNIVVLEERSDPSERFPGGLILPRH
jgi:hypothetical protein